MHRHAYRFSFDPSVSFDAVDSAFTLALLAAECLHGESAVRVEARYASDPERSVIVIDGATPVGLSINRLFAGFARYEFGTDSFIVEFADVLGESAAQRAA